MDEQKGVSMRRLGNIACLLLVLSAGCSTVTELRQPRKVPVFVSSFESAALRAKTADVPCILNGINVPMVATVSEIGFSGRRTPGPEYPIGDIVANEFQQVLVHNFGPVEAGTKARLELRLDPQKLILERDGNDLVCEVSIFVLLLNPDHQDKPYFSKTYAVRTIGTMMDEETVPECVYEAVQKVASQFVCEIGSDPQSLARLAELN